MTSLLSSWPWRVWTRDRDVFLQHWKTDAIPLTIEPFMIFALMGLCIGAVVQKIDGQSYYQFLGPGLPASYVMFAPPSRAPGIPNSAWPCGTSMTPRLSPR